MITRPLLAVALEDIDSLKYPQYCTPKYDGIRCLIIDGKAVSRNFKSQPNKYIRKTLEALLPDGMDGELVLKDPTPVMGCSLEESNGVVKVNFNDTQSKVMSFEGEPDFEYHIFDYVKESLDKPYLARIKDLKEIYATMASTYSMDSEYFDEEFDRIKLVLPVCVKNKEELLAYESECLAAGYEGIILRSPEGRYKCGRSTLKESILLKLKRFVDSEAEVIGFEERLHNANEQEEDEFGLAKRASCKANLVPDGTLGALIVKDIKTGVDFNVGSGYNDQLRKEIWDNRDKYLGKTITYKSQNIGSKDKPRFPIFKSFRESGDMD